MSKHVIKVPQNVNRYLTVKEKFGVLDRKIQCFFLQIQVKNTELFFYFSAR
ncbi:hypothetical protein SAMN05444410_11854 [Hydrobacter penzbergensis]|jgi:hypothetical protein|uniref:Uncharacterized protein n=1 Tax=Hydrobacter penzbergensis TaxID=1235997 RepID=A0A8X8LFU2_9BACT|nr:hypothetical protein CLV53_10331 [Sediminibacterium magnilacihabitans]SDX51613.1 hypothetical protein SAMN05444410_11854 [Hydrobacter penzbergensis]